MAEPKLAEGSPREETSQPYDLDNPNNSGVTISTLDGGITECTFKAIHLLHIGTPYLDLSKYGKVRYESADKLVMTINDDEPLELIMVVKQIWVTKHVPMGARCIMRFGPLWIDEDVDFAVERVNSDTTYEQPQLPTSASMSSSDHYELYTIPEEEDEE
ncbi:hypothetical protein F4818DRAFT_138925 [Hypoxylon cercidicola]|nr:hypothetical protein F4818DRAFT_138925 [Hypoxylon cercidicola]